MAVPLVLKHGLLTNMPDSFAAECQFSTQDALYLFSSSPPAMYKMALPDDLIPKGEGWQEVQAPPRAGGYAAVAVDGHIVYFAGGREANHNSITLGGPLKWLSVYDATTNTWSVGPDMPYGVWSASAAIVGRKLYVIGGNTDTGDQFAVYDLDARVWSGPIPAPWSGSAPGKACVAYGNKIYLLGGVGINQSFDTVTNEWSRLADAPATVKWMGGSAMIVGDNVVVYIYTYMNGYQCQLLAYSISANTFQPFGGNMIEMAGGGAGAVASQDNLALLVLAGGYRTLTPQPTDPVNRSVEYWGFDLDLTPSAPAIKASWKVKYGQAGSDASTDGGGKLGAPPPLRTVFGSDDRVEVVNLTDDSRRAACQGIGGVIENALLVAQPSGGAQIQPQRDLQTTVHDLTGHTIAPDQLFKEQPCAMVGTCFRIGTRLVVTAAHVISDGTNILDTSNYRVVFGWLADSLGGWKQTVPPEKLYRIASVKRWALQMQDGASTYDWAILETDRDIDQSVPMFSFASALPAAGDTIWTAGHGMGLPMKYSTGTVRDVSGARTFESTINSFQGNSGSPVLSASNKVVGILTGGPSSEWTVSADGFARATIFDPTNAQAWINMQKVADVAAQIGPLQGVLTLTITVGSGRWADSADPVGAGINRGTHDPHWTPGPYPKSTSRVLAYATSLSSIVDVDDITFQGGGENWEFDSLNIVRISLKVNGAEWFSASPKLFWLISGVPDVHVAVSARWAPA